MTPYAGVLLIVGAVAVWIFRQASPIALGGDNELLTHPLLVEATRQLRQGRLPVWTTTRWGGSPLLGDPVAGALYPIAYLGYAITDAPHAWALDVMVVVHLGILATGVVWLLRGLGVSRGPAMAGAVLVMLNPTLAYIARSWIQYWAALAWWPWLFGAAVRLSSHARQRDLWVSAVAIAAQVFAGYPQFALYSAAVALGLLAVVPASGVPRLRLVLGVGSAACLLGLPAVLASLDMIADSGRAGARTVDRDALDFFAISAKGWMDVPTTKPISPIDFARIPPVVLALGLLATIGGTRSMRFLGGAAIVSALLASSPAIPFQWLHSIPPLTVFWGPIKCFYLAAFLWTALAGAGLGAVAPGTRWSRPFAMLVAFLAMASWRWDAAVAAALAARLVPARHCVGAAAGFACAGAAAFFLAAGVMHARQPFARDQFSLLLHRSPAAIWPAAPARPWIAIGEAPRIRIVAGNFGSLWGLDSLSGKGPLRPSLQEGIFDGITKGRIAAFLRQLGAVNVIVGVGGAVESELSAAGFTSLAREGALRAMVARYPPPGRVELARRARSVSADDAVVAAKRGIALSHGTVMVEGPVSPDPAEGDPSGEARIVAEQPGLLDVEVGVDRPTWLVVRQPHYHGWTARIDGRPAELSRAAGLFMAIRVPAGRHRVLLRYAEPGVLVGSSIVGIVLLALSLAARRRVSPPRAGAAPTAAVGVEPDAYRIG